MKKHCSYCKAGIEIKKCRVKEHNFCSSKHFITFQYENGMIDTKKRTEKAHQTIREKGHYKRDNVYLKERNPATSVVARKKISEAKLKSNWMRGRVSPNNIGGKTMYRGHRWKEIKKQAKERDSFKCVNCGMAEYLHFEKHGQPLQVDHIIPYKITRDNSLENLQTLCCPCHGAKWASDLKLIKEYKIV